MNVIELMVFLGIIWAGVEFVRLWVHFPEGFSMAVTLVIAALIYLLLLCIGWIVQRSQPRE